VAQRYQAPGVDVRIDGVVPAAIDPALLQQPYVVRPAGRHLAYAGRLETNKGVAGLLDLFCALAPARPDLSLTLLGDGPLRPVLEQRAAHAGVGRRVRFAGEQPPEALWRALASADVFVFPSRFETLGLAALEAMALGVPVVASDLPALRDATGGLAVYQPAGNGAAWQPAVADLLADEAGRQHLSREGRRWAARFTWPQAAAQLEAYLYQAMASPRRSAPG
jgi:glycosyltransferase involved in cell wall biosynthesis